MIISQHLCLVEFREIFRMCLCVLREWLVHNCKLLPLLQVVLTRLSPSRLTIRNLLLIWWFFTAGNLFLHSWIEWKWVLFAFSSRFHGPFIISKPIRLHTSLTKLGKQSWRRNRQLLVRRVITKHKAQGSSCHINTVFKIMAARRQFQERTFRGLLAHSECFIWNGGLNSQFLNGVGKALEELVRLISLSVINSAHPPACLQHPGLPLGPPMLRTPSTPGPVCIHPSFDGSVAWAPQTTHRHLQVHSSRPHLLSS